MAIQVDVPPPLRDSSLNSERPYKRAIALITCYRKDYFEKVLQSIDQQRIAGISIFDLYDFYIFQDGLSGLDDVNKEEHIAISEIVRNHQHIKQFFLQEKNLGIAKHFAFVEDYLFNHV